MTTRFIGGPLYGHTTTRTRWPIYLDDQGDWLPTSRGDREFCSYAGRPLRRYYAHRLDKGEHLYLHATATLAWHAERERWS